MLSLLLNNKSKSEETYKNDFGRIVVYQQGIELVNTGPMVV